jgi:hypothetical protein
MRSPRMHGTPSICFGFTVILVNFMMLGSNCPAQAVCQLHTAFMGGVVPVEEGEVVKEIGKHRIHHFGRP